MAICVRSTGIRYSSRTEARLQRDPFPHRRHSAPGLPGAGRCHDRDDRTHQIAGPDGRDRKAPPAGRAHQNPHVRRPGNRIAPVDPADCLRRKNGHADFRSRSGRQDPARARLPACRRAPLG